MLAAIADFVPDNLLDWSTLVLNGFLIWAAVRGIEQVREIASDINLTAQATARAADASVATARRTDPIGESQRFKLMTLDTRAYYEKMHGVARDVHKEIERLLAEQPDLVDSILVEDLMSDDVRGLIVRLKAERARP